MTQFDLRICFKWVVVAGHLKIFVGPEVSFRSGIMTLKWLEKNIASNFRVNQGTSGCTPDSVQCTHGIYVNSVR